MLHRQTAAVPGLGRPLQHDAGLETLPAMPSVMEETPGCQGRQVRRAKQGHPGHGRACCQRVNAGAGCIRGNQRSGMNVVSALSFRSMVCSVLVTTY